MLIEETRLEGCYIIKNNLFKDSRGYFFESFNQDKFNTLTGLKIKFVQDNQSQSSKGVLRGLHFQNGKNSQAKLVRVLEGRVLDIAVDLRKNSKTFGEYISIELTAKNQKQLFVPRGFAHGFLVLSEIATFFYKCDNYYNKLSESGIIYNDPELSIDWRMNHEELILSEKDLTLKKMEEIKKNLNF